MGVVEKSTASCHCSYFAPILSVVGISGGFGVGEDVGGVNCGGSGEFHSLLSLPPASPYPSPPSSLLKFNPRDFHLIPVLVVVVFVFVFKPNNITMGII